MSTIRSASLPTGEVTFLFTDIEDSTRLLAELGDSYDALLRRHEDIIRGCLADHGGVEVNTEGDAFFAVFVSPADAAAAVTSAQSQLAAEAWPDGYAIRVRMGLHTGTGRLGGRDYSGIDVNRAARVAASGHGGQVVVSDATRESLADDAAGEPLRDLGYHELKGLPEPERIWQLDIEGLPTEFPPLRTKSRQRGNLPAQGSSLVGRAIEVDAVRSFLEGSSLVTLTGPGGTGKTRLALEVATHEASGFSGGAWFVELAAARNRSDTAAAIALALGVRDASERTLEAGLKEYLDDRQLLLVLDNLEQAVEAIPLISELMATSPGVTILATSRSALRIRGEQEFEVPPLADEASVSLFVDRATAVRPSFELTAENGAAITEICRRLDGLPLAIELAAVRVRMLAPQAILDRLERRLPLLKDGGRDRPERQRTLTAAIDWSYDLLGPAEQRLFARLSVFAGGWDLDMAEAVCGDDETDVFDGLQSLVEHSLVRAPSDDAIEPRFAMLQVIREYAVQRLSEHPDAGAVARRHAIAITDLAERARPELMRRDLRAWNLRIRDEEDNVRAALRWAIETRDASIALRIVGSLWRSWWYWGQTTEGIAWVEAALALPSTPDMLAERARATTSLAGLVYWKGETDRSDAAYDSAIEMYRELGDDQLLAETLLDSIYSGLAKQDLDPYFARSDEALALLRRTGDTVNAASVRAWQAAMSYSSGRGGTLEDAIAVTLEAVDANRSGGHIHIATEMLALVARIERLSGRIGDARPHQQEALRYFYELGNVGRLPGVLKVFAALEVACGQPERAVRLASAAEQMAEEMGGRLSDAILKAGDPIEETRALLSPEAHAAGVQEGLLMTTDEAVSYALAG